MCSFVTWSDWDLGVCLLYECKRKQLKKPDILNSWIDLRATYKLFYNRRPKGLNGALQDLGIEFSGREHSGLDDSRNTAKLAWRMICDGCVMKITKSLDKVYSKISYARPLQAQGGKCEEDIQTCTKELDAGMNISNTHKVQEYRSLTLNNKPLVNQEEAESISSRLPQTLINGLSTTLGNGPKHSFSNQNSLITLQSGKHIGAFSSTPMEHSSSRPEHVLMSTTITSVTDISALDITSSSECLSMLVDWEEAAVIADSQENTSGTVPGVQSDILIRDSTICMPVSDISNNNKLTNAKCVQPQGSCGSSVIYRSKDTTIYDIKVKERKSTCSTFKLPNISVNKSTKGLISVSPQNKISTSMSTYTKRKLSSVSFYSPPKKQPFTIHADLDSAINRSLPVTSKQHGKVSPTVLNATVNMNSTFRSAQSGKITAPMCKCGRRAKRLTVSNGGPNQGKAFYTCAVKKRNEQNTKGCEYFKWEYAVLKEKSIQSLILLSPTGMSFTTNTNVTPVTPAATSASRKSFVLRPSMRT
ncbi:hypothetical protein GDO86_017405 [Hymenochirus boettgeri]|nr:hypothetical protein GDO86_017405 [Hymenochirus boettgeri]